MKTAFDYIAESFSKPANNSFSYRFNAWLEIKDLAGTSFYEGQSCRNKEDAHGFILSRTNHWTLTGLEVVDSGIKRKRVRDA